MLGESKSGLLPMSLTVTAAGTSVLPFRGVASDEIPQDLKDVCDRLGYRLVQRTYFI